MEILQVAIHANPTANPTTNAPTSVAFSNGDEFKQRAFAYTFDHFDEFLGMYPSIMDKLSEANKVVQQKQLDDAMKQREEELHHHMEQQQQTLQHALEKAYQDKLQQQLDEKQKVIDEYIKANQNKTGTHSLYRGETFEKYIELLVAKKFQTFTIDGSGATGCMDVRMTNTADQTKTIGIECKSKNAVNATDLKKFTKDKVSNAFWGSIFISECNIIPKKTAQQDEWAMIDNELWIQSSNENVIACAIGSFIAMLEREERQAGSHDRQIILQQTDFITTLYDKLHVQKQSLFEQEKQMYGWVKQHKPDKLRNHLYIVAGSKLTKKYKECPY